MEYFLFITALTVCIIHCLSAFDLFRGIRSMTRLSTVEQLPADQQPMVSIVVPACNEEENIETAMKTLLSQEYQKFEILAVNDRSTDRTGKILEKLQQKDKRLRVFHIKKDDLPQGWMGKAHALNYAADQAHGHYLLFTDADIQMEKSTVCRAVHYMEREALDHLTLLFKNISPGWLLNSLILDSGAGLLQMMRPWLSKKKGSNNFVGVGGFNLVKRVVYQAVGGHGQIKMHPIDDVMLGKIIKRRGFNQECLLGQDLVTVPWYSGVGQMVEGLMKNILAVIHFRFYLVPLALAAICIVGMVPLLGIFFTGGTIQLIFSITVVIKISMFFFGARMLQISPLCSLGTLVTPYISFYIVAKAAWRNFRDRGIYWRGSFYPLEQLRKNEPLFF